MSPGGGTGGGTGIDLIDLPAGCVAVIFSSCAAADRAGYQATAERMVALATAQPGFLGVEHAASDGHAITISYGRDRAAVAAWRDHAEHQMAQHHGRTRWYAGFRLILADVAAVRVFRAPAGGAPAGGAPAGGTPADGAGGSGMLDPATAPQLPAAGSRAAGSDSA